MSSRSRGSRDRESRSGVERSGGVLGLSIIFAAITFAAVWLLTAALLHLLAELLGSLLLALLITGGAATLISIALYFSAIRPRIDHATRQIRELYEISCYTTLVYRKVKSFINLFI